VRGERIVVRRRAHRARGRGAVRVGRVDPRYVAAATLNGQAITGVTPGSYGAFVVLPITAPFVVGTNTISLVSSNSGGPTGFRAELALTTN
jgi:hypothetical protein